MKKIKLFLATVCLLVGNTIISQATVPSAVGELTDGDTKPIGVIIVTDVNEAPTITGTPDTTVAEDSPYSFTPVGNDVNQGDILTYSISNNPSWLEVDSSTGTLSGTPENEDVGTTNGIILLVTDQGGLSDNLTFNLEVTNTNDLPTGNVTIIGTATVGKVLTADVSKIADVDGLGELYYIWKANGFRVYEGGNTFELVGNGGVIGRRISVQVFYYDDGGAYESLTSNATAVVTAFNNDPVGGVTTSRTATQGETLTADISSITDADGIGVFNYKWQAEGINIPDATSKTFTPTQTQVGKTIKVIASYTDRGGTVEILTSSPTSKVENINDSPEGEVTISGTIRQEETLTAVTSGINDADGLGEFSYQWQAGNTNISDATHKTFTLTQAEVGQTIKVVVSYTDGESTPESVTSNPTIDVENINALPTGEATIEGEAREGKTLTAISTIADADGVGELHYQWKSEIKGDISGATSNKFTLKEAQVGEHILVIVSYTDGDGNAESVESNPTNEVIVANEAPSGDITIRGVARQGEVLTAVTTSIIDNDGLTNAVFSYQWKSVENNIYSDISGATESTFTLTQAQVGKRISVEISYTDDRGADEEITCHHLTSTVEGSTLGDEDFKISDLSVWPNPTKSILNITVIKKTDYRLLNIIGKTLKKGTLTKGSNSVDVSSLPRGIYLLNIETARGSLTKKVIKN